MNDTLDIQKYKSLLTEERDRLLSELQDIGKVDNQNEDDWHATAGELQTGTADAQVLADRFEEKLTNEGIVANLEKRLQEVRDALERIDAGTYGTCTECGERIPAERLDANPAASTCITHSA